MKYFELNEIESEEIEDLIFMIEDSFGFKFDQNELINVETFGELCSKVKVKIELENKNDCTGQQAFHKLKNAIESTMDTKSLKLTPKTKLESILPKQNRILETKKIEEKLGFKLSILRPRKWVTNILLLMFLGSIITLFIDWKIGLSSLIMSIVGLIIAQKTGKEFDLETVGDVTKKMVCENYIKSRKNPMTFNESEIDDVIIDLFHTYLDIDKSILNKKASFV